MYRLLWETNQHHLSTLPQVGEARVNHGSVPTTLTDTPHPCPRRQFHYRLQHTTMAGFELFSCIKIKEKMKIYFFTSAPYTIDFVL